MGYYLIMMSRRVDRVIPIGRNQSVRKLINRDGVRVYQVLMSILRDEYLAR